MEQLGDQGLGRWADVVWDVVLVVLDPVIGLLQTLRLKRRLANEQGIAEEQKRGNHSLGPPEACFPNISYAVLVSVLTMPPKAIAEKLLKWLAKIFFLACEFHKSLHIIIIAVFM